MMQQIKSIAWAVGLIFILAFMLFLVNQVVQFYASLQIIAPSFALPLTITMGIGLLMLLLVPLFLIFKLPEPLRPPKTEQEAIEFNLKLCKRLKTNPFLKSQNACDLPVEETIALLNETANHKIKQTANTVFLTTAISQNGKLDALSVLISQTRLVWDLAHLYYQRPSIRDLTNLYANVGAATFMAGQLEGLDLSERMEPIVRSIVRSMTGKSIPVIGNTASLVMDSLLEGSTNAFLTLRVGIIARDYCSGRYFESTRKAKISAFREASGMLGDIVVKASKEVVSAIATATKNTGIKTIKGGFNAVKSTGTKISDQFVNTGKKLNPFGKKVKTDAELTETKSENTPK